MEDHPTLMDKFNGYFLVVITGLFSGQVRKAMIKDVYRLIGRFNIIKVAVVALKKYECFVYFYRQFPEYVGDGIIKANAMDGPIIFPDKILNFRNTSYRVTGRDYPPYFLCNLIDGQEYWSGYDIDLLQLLSEILNFHISFQKCARDPQTIFKLVNLLCFIIFMKICDYLYRRSM